MSEVKPIRITATDHIKGRKIAGMGNLSEPMKQKRALCFIGGKADKGTLNVYLGGKKR